MNRQHSGKVTLVGAGPGDPGLITIRGVVCLQQADVVLYDYLVNPVIAEHAPSCSEQICLGRHGRTRIWSQDEINAALLKHYRDGKNVVRLKGGDPAVFARGGEEAAFLQEHNIPMEIVPGITAALAAGSHAGIPVTHRDHASAVALVTGHEKDPDHSHLDYAALAKFPGTIVFYMGVTTATRWSNALISHGMSPATPVAIVRRCSLPDQKILRCQLADVAEQVTPYRKYPPPVIFVVGDVARLGQSGHWFEQRPLFGKSVVITRPVATAAPLSQQLTERGAHVWIAPAIEIHPPADIEPLRAAVRSLDQYDWVVFTSINGVEAFFCQLNAAGKDVRALGGIKVASIGPTTSRSLQQFHIQADLEPTASRSESLLTELIEPTRAKCVLIVRANRGREILASKLQASAARVDEVIAYESRDVSELPPAAMQAIHRQQVDYVTITSPAIARSMHRLLGHQAMASMSLVSISPVTTAALTSLGFSDIIESPTATAAGIVEAMVGDAHRAEP